MEGRSRATHGRADARGIAVCRNEWKRGTGTIGANTEFCTWADPEAVCNLRLILKIVTKMM